MTDQLVTGRPARPGRPRDSGIDDRILEAARRLFVDEGYDAVTIAAVARVAGLPRSTVYRRYKGPVALRYAAAIIPAGGLPPLDETGDVRADMGAHITANASGFRRTEDIELLRSLTADALSDPDGRAALNDGFVRPRLAHVVDLLERARERGDLPVNVDPDLASKAITGTLIYHALLLDEPVDDTFVTRLVELLFPLRDVGR